MSAPSPSPSVPRDQALKLSRSRSAHEITTTRCRCRGRKSPPVAWRRSWNAISATSRSATFASSPCRRRSPSTSGTVSISKASTGVIACRASAREDASGEVAVAAIAHDRDDHGVLDLAQHLQRGPQRAAGGDAGEYTFLAREPPGRFLGVGLGDLDHAVDALPVADL